MSRLSIDPLLQDVYPWAFAVEVAGVDHPVRRLSNAEVKQLTTLGAGDEEKARNLVAGFFAEPAAIRPLLDDDDTLQAVVMAISIYFADYTKKKQLSQKAMLEKQLQATRST